MALLERLDPKSNRSDLRRRSKLARCRALGTIQSDSLVFVKSVVLDSDSGKIARIAVIAAVLGGLIALGVVIAMPWALVAIPALVQPKLWKRARERLTARLDRFPAATQ